MKKVITLKCPNCGSNLSFGEERDYLFCQYCGVKLIIDNENEHIYRHIDEADMKRAETEKIVKLKKIEFNEKKAKKESKTDMLIGIIVIILLIVGVVSFNSYFSGEESKSIQQEATLQELVDEIMNDVKEERFDDAYIKAQSIKYTENWSDEIEEKWDNTRKQVINYIIQEEKRVTGKSSHKPEKDGFFSNLFK